MPPVSHPLRFSTIAHADRQVLGPMSPVRLEALVERCALDAGDHVLEVGCGKGAFLLASLARWTGATAEGFDRNPWFLADARAAAEAATATGSDIARRVSFIETDAPGSLLAGRAAAMTVAMGATGAFDGDQAAAMTALAGAVRRGGSVIFADGLWLREPPADGLATFGMARDELVDGVDGFATLGVGAGLEVQEIDVVSESEWDDYEAAYAAAVERWAAANPDDPERDAFVARAADMRGSYADWRRDAFGYAIGRFRAPR